MPHVGNLPSKQNQLANEERSTFHQTYGQAQGNGLTNAANGQGNTSSKLLNGMRFQSPDAKSSIGLNNLGGSDDKNGASLSNGKQ